MLSKFCFLKIVQGCQIGKVFASFYHTESQSRQPVVSIFPLDGVGVVQTKQTKPNISVVSISPLATSWSGMETNEVIKSDLIVFFNV